MRYADGRPRRPPRPGQRSSLSLFQQVVRRCLPWLFLRRALYLEGSPVRRCCVRLLLLLVFLLLNLLVFLFCYLLIAQNETTVMNQHLSEPIAVPKEPRPYLSLESASPAERHAIQKSLNKFVPRTTGPEPHPRYSGFLSTYFDLEERALPTLTKAALEAWFAHTAPTAVVAEEVLLQHAWPNASAPTVPQDATTADEEEEDFYRLLAFLFPPAQQQRYYRTALNEILGFGTRVGGTAREPLLHHLLREGLGRACYDAERGRYRRAPHLSAKAVELLEKAAPTWPAAPHFAVARDDTRVAGWRWSLMWDNFSTTIPIPVKGHAPSTSAAVSMQNFVFQFPGGSQFRRKRAAVVDQRDVFVGCHTRPNRSRSAVRSELMTSEFHPLDGTVDVYEQETFVKPGHRPTQQVYLPQLRREMPGTKVPITTPGRPVPLKPSLSTQVAQPVSRQPVQHAVYAAHWDSMRQSDIRFLGACDSAVPMVYLLRAIKNIAVLTDAAEALTEAYKAERHGADGVAAVPGLTATFRASTTEAEVRTRLAELLSPAHHALLFQYALARPYVIGGEGPNNHSSGDPGARNYPSAVQVDVRMWLDWVQHLPALSFVFFDGEEAFEEWKDNDHTYGSRHLAQRWRAVTTATQTRYSGGPQSLFDTVDLFALYDLMGTAGTTFHNLFPTQSGIYYAALAQREKAMRRRAFDDASAVTAELLWRVLGSSHVKEEKEERDLAATGMTAAAATSSAADGYVRQLGANVDVAVAALAPQHVAKLLANALSRPSRETLPRPWLLYGTPHEMLTLHRISLIHFQSTHGGTGDLASLRLYDSLYPEVVQQAGFDPYNYLLFSNGNIFFPSSSATLRRHQHTDPVVEDDHLHWLDTQRVLHLISVPFPESWHKESDDGRDIHDGTTVDLGNVLWSTVLELGHYWTGENGAA